MAEASREKMVQYLEEAHALEAALVSTLTAHISMTPRGPYRDLLERHQGETAAHRDRLQERLRQLGAGRSPIEAVYGLAQTLVGQALALGKLPYDLLRGGSGEEKLLKNAKDEAASEALEIATYDAIEALAVDRDDPKTVTLAREHRMQEETFLAHLRELIPELARDVAAAEIDGDRSYDVTTTGAADAARKVARRAGSKAGRAAADAAGTASDAAGRVRDQVRRVPGEAELEGEIRGAAAGGDEELPIADYDALTVEQLLPMLRALSAEELARIDGYERGGRSRKRILVRVAALRDRKVDEELTTIP
jgi:ferritin-like metal-binding protein YciE